MRVAFAGTPVFAAQALDRLVDAGFEVPLVLTQPDRPAGRGMKLQPSAVNQAALSRDIPVLQPLSLRLDGRHADDAQAARDALLACAPDVMVVAAYGLILPAWTLVLPRWGCLNIHASLLPRWRGAAPIHRAIEAGDAETGISIMQMDEGLDTGAVLVSQSVPIGSEDTTPVLHDRLAALGADLVVNVVQQLPTGALRPVPQPSAGVTYAHKLDKAEAWIDWSLPADLIARRVRAFAPSPGTQTTWAGVLLKVCGARVAPEMGLAPAPVGVVVRVDEAGIWVQTGRGCLCVTELQRAGGRRMPVGAFLQGQPVPVGSLFGGMHP